MEIDSGMESKSKTADRLSIVIACLSFLLDFTLYSVIVPIVPVYLHSKSTNSSEEDYSNQVCENGSVLFMPADGGNTDSWNARHEDLMIGILFGSKAMMQALFTFVSGPMIDRFGCPVPMMTGISVLLLSTIVFAFGKSYVVLFIARSIQGVGSAFSTTAAFSLLANQFKDKPVAQHKAQGYAMACVYLGMVSGPLIGGVLYQFAGKEVPFLLLAGIAVIHLGLMGFVFIYINPNPILTSHVVFDGNSQPRGISIFRLLLDPFIVVCAGSVFLANLSVSFLEPTIALWMKMKMQSSEWEIGIIWLSAYIPQLIGIFSTVALLQHYPSRQWLVIIVGTLAVGSSSLLIPLCDHFWLLFGPIMIISLEIAMIDMAILPTLAFLADTRYSSQYGSVYSIDNIACSLSYGFGPMAAGWIVETIGFRWMTVIVCLFNISFIPAVTLLRKLNPEVSEGIGIKEEEGSSRVDVLPDSVELFYVALDGRTVKPQHERGGEGDVTEHGGPGFESLFQ